MYLDLVSLEVVKRFVKIFRESGRFLEVLVCNVAVYLLLLKELMWSIDGYEISVVINYFGYFFFCNLMLEDLKKFFVKDKRLVILGIVIVNLKELGGKISILVFLDLGNL